MKIEDYVVEQTISRWYFLVVQKALVFLFCFLLFLCGGVLDCVNLRDTKVNDDTRGVRWCTPYTLYEDCTRETSYVGDFVRTKELMNT